MLLILEKYRKKIPYMITWFIGARKYLKNVKLDLIFYTKHLTLLFDSKAFNGSEVYHQKM